MIQTIQNIGLAICIDNVDYPASLDLHAVYDVLPEGEPGLGLIRIVDESGDDYLYPEESFVVVTEVMPNVRKILEANLTELERAARGFIEDHVDLLDGGTPFALSRIYTQGSAIFVALTEETVELTNDAAKAKRRLARAVTDRTTPPKRLMHLEKREANASRAYIQSSIVNQEMQGFLKRVYSLIPEEFKKQS